MKEIMAIVRPQKVNATKVALAEAGFPSFTCQPVLGRGKKFIDAGIAAGIVEAGELPDNAVGETLTEPTRLISKRMFTLIVEDDDISKIVEIITAVNKTGTPGDGRIFVLPISESFRVRNGEPAADAY
jgi:nitrogen regulatory protein PII 2